MTSRIYSYQIKECGIQICNHNPISGLHLGLRWYFGDMLLFDTRNRNIYPPNSRARVSDNGSLVVDDVQAEDTGDYYCEVVLSDEPAIRQEHSIEVQCEIS